MDKKKKGTDKNGSSKQTKKSEVVKEKTTVEEISEDAVETIAFGGEMIMTSPMPVMTLVHAELIKSQAECVELTKALQESGIVTTALTTELEKALKEPEYLVVIPYLAEEAQGNEIELAIRGWDKHFKENFTLVIVGDYPSPQIMKNLECLSPESNERIIHIGHECITNNPPLDIVAKLQLVIETLPHFDRLILTNDDIYPINDFDITEVKLLKSDGLLTDAKKVGELYAENRKRTLDLFNNVNMLSCYDYGCHTPVYLETEKLLQLIYNYNLTEQAYLLTSLYFNFFHPNRIPLKLDRDFDNLKVTVGRPNANLTLLKQEFMSRKIWISNPTAGWSKELAEIIDKRLG